MVIYKFFILLYVQNITGFQVKYSPPIEAGASFNPPNLAKDAIYVVKGKVSLTADGQFIPPP